MRVLVRECVHLCACMGVRVQVNTNGNVECRDIVSCGQPPVADAAVRIVDSDSCQVGSSSQPPDPLSLAYGCFGAWPIYST